MDTVMKYLIVFAVIVSVLFLTVLVAEVVYSAIMNSGTVSQIMSPDFNLERVMVEASE